MKSIHSIPVIAIATIFFSYCSAASAEAASSLQSKDQSVELIDAVRTGNQSRVKALLAKGVDPNARGADGITPLLVAASMGSIEIANALLAKGAEVNAH